MKVLENDRVAAWNYSWIQGRPAPTHFHVHQQVVAYRSDGAIKTIAPDGKTTRTHTRRAKSASPSPTAFIPSNGTGRMSAVVLELK